MRRAEPALATGAFALVDASAGVLAYERIEDGRRLRILLNLTDVAVAIDWRGTSLLSTLAGDPEPGMLRGNEGLILA